MSESTIAKIQAKIKAAEEQIARLKITEFELKALSVTTIARAMPTAPAKRGRPRKEVLATVGVSVDSTKQTVAARIRDYLRTKGPVRMKALKEDLGLEGRPVSFTLQALKRAGEAKKVDGEWSMQGRG